METRSSRRSEPSTRSFARARCGTSRPPISAERLRESLETSDREGLVRYVGLQTHYNLVHRDEYGGRCNVCAAEGVA